MLGQTPVALAQKISLFNAVIASGGHQMHHTASRASVWSARVLIEGPDWMREECVAYTMVPGKVTRGAASAPCETCGPLHLLVHKEFREIEVLVLKLPGDGTRSRLQPKELGSNVHVDINYGALKIARL